MLKLERLPVELKTFSPFSDRRGKSGVVIKIAMSTPPEVLDQLMQGLSAALYKRPDVISAQKDAAQSPTRFPQIRGLDIDYQINGATIEIGRDDLLEQCRMRYGDCEVTKLRPVLADGSCDWTFLVRISDPQPDDVGRLYTLLKKVVILTLTPPEAATYDAQDPRTGDLLAGEHRETHEIVAEIWAEQDAQAAAERDEGGDGDPDAGDLPAFDDDLDAEQEAQPEPVVPPAKPKRARKSRAASH